jgi:hypothetical protein
MNQEQFDATSFDDLRKMTPEELAVWFEWEPEPIPLTSFPLGSEEGRRAFLREFYGVGWDWLFQAVNHVWISLAEPRSARCTAMGIAAGTRGTGRRALVKVLSKFLEDALNVNTPLPARCDYDSLAAWHEASMATWQRDEAEIQVLACKYAGLLNGGLLAVAAPPLGQLILGPWHSR